MPKIFQAMIWGLAIIVVALVSKASALGDGAATGIVMGLTGAAWASLGDSGRCASLSGCLQ